MMGRRGHALHAGAIPGNGDVLINLEVVASFR